MEVLNLTLMLNQRILLLFVWYNAELKLLEKIIKLKIPFR